MSEQPLVSVREASRMLGVSEATLRQWTDEGSVKAFITPGGHRRYSTSDLRRFMSPRRKVLGAKDLAAELQETAQAHREIGRELLKDTSWYGRVDMESQEKLARLGRHLLQLIIQYVTEPSKRKEVISVASEVGQEFGNTLARLGLPLTDSVQAFLLHRDPIVEATAQLMKRRFAYSGRVVEAVAGLDRVLDAALISLVFAHQHRTSASAPPERGVLS